LAGPRQSMTGCLSRLSAVLAAHGVRGRPFASKAVVSAVLASSASLRARTLITQQLIVWWPQAGRVCDLTFRSIGGESPPSSPTRFRGLRLPVRHRLARCASWLPPVVWCTANTTRRWRMRLELRLGSGRCGLVHTYAFPLKAEVRGLGRMMV